MNYVVIERSFSDRSYVHGFFSSRQAGEAWAKKAFCNQSCTWSVVIFFDVPSNDFSRIQGVSHG